MQFSLRMLIAAAPRRRWLQFSLRGFLVVLSIGCLWLGWKVDRAHKQRDAVETIEAIGGIVVYDWQACVDSWVISPATSKYSRWGASPAYRYLPDDSEPPAPAWLRSLLGDHLFQNPTSVIFRTRHAFYGWDAKHTLLYLSVPGPDAARTNEIEAIAPQLHDLPTLRDIYLQGDEKTISKAVEDRLSRDFPHCRVVRDSVVTAVK